MTYSMWMLEYSRCLAQPVGCIFYGAWNAGTRPFSYSYVYIESEGHRILVDTGHDNRTSNRYYSDKNHIVDYQYPDVVLGKLRVSPEEIDTVILTHAHYDHAGAMHWFPNATFYLQRRELVASREAIDAAPLYDSLIGALDPEDVRELEQLADEGRLILLDGPLELFPGLQIRTAWDTHTIGGQYVVLTDGQSRPWVITGDAMYSYENAEGIGGDGTYVNIGFGGGSGWKGLRLIDEMVKVVSDTNRLVIVHEPATFRRHPSHRSGDGLSVAELVLAPGVTSRLGGGADRADSQAVGTESKWGASVASQTHPITDAVPMRRGQASA